ncbi:class I SAM-dependent methyltransferase [Streptomyces pseudogriseolus]|uniref:class I SAM-dependent methyltransferase n=1 Tax=Streptomyces pseudogriseolus TaxID=36817 RepID=UPI003FA325AA
MSTTDEQMSAEAYCAETFNAAIASAALSAAWETGLLDELATTRRVVAEEFARSNDAHPEVVRALLVALSSRRIVKLDADRAVATTDVGFDNAYRTRGFFYWLTRGCGELLTALGTKVTYKDRQGDYIHRDARAISVACRSIARTFFDPPFRELIEGIDFGTVADLGCGSGDRITMLANLRPELRAVGIDIAEEAISVAEEAVEKAGFGDRITLVQDNALHLTPRPEYEDVELVTCFLMGHDFWPRDVCVKTLRELRATFPNLKHLVLGDTCRSTGIEGVAFPMFTLGFETVHTVMDQYLPTLEEWEGVLEESGWRVADRRTIDLPAFSFVYRLTPA